jgi:hypothetical protein
MYLNANLSGKFDNSHPPMIQTQFGNFDGDKWERICKICFLLKYDSEQYVPIVASPGDYGIEGFTKSGKAFQCYCPNQHYTSDELYEKQRDKITQDLLKLKLNEGEIKKRIGETRIFVWYFITPQYRKNDIVAHCVKKEKEVRAWKLSIIDNAKFNVIPQDIDFLHPHLTTALTGSGTKLNVASDDPTESEVFQYKSDAGYLVTNAKSKHEKRLQNNRGSKASAVDKFTHATISDFLKGSAIIERFKTLVPDQYERFVKIIKQETTDVEDLSVSPSGNHNQRYIDVKKDVESKISSSFPNLDEIMVTELSRYVIADWILRCPLDFINDD